MGKGSSREASGSAGEGPAQQSLQHLFDTLRRSDDVSIRGIWFSSKSFPLSLDYRQSSRASLFAVADPLVGPLSQPRGDDTDGGEPNVAEDEERLQPRSDDEDT